jgi:hypothetical protein
MLKDDSPLNLNKDISLLAFAKKWEFHLRVLQLFLQEQENVSARARQALLCKDIEKAQRENHTLRGLIEIIRDNYIYPVPKALDEGLSKNYNQVTISHIIEQLAEEMCELIQILNKTTEKKH